jgi:hypothetical protein
MTGMGGVGLESGAFSRSHGEHRASAQSAWNPAERAADQRVLPLMLEIDATRCVDNGFRMRGSKRAGAEEASRPTPKRFKKNRKRTQLFGYRGPL